MKHTDNHAETTNTNKDANKETVDQEPENKQTSDQTNAISTIPEISEDALVKPTLTQEASSQPERSANQEDIQQVISNDMLVANVDDESKPIEQSNQLNTDRLETDQNQFLSNENLQSTDAVTTVPITSTNDVQNAEVENSVSEDVHSSTDESKVETTSKETSLDEPSTSTHDNQLSIESTAGENIDKETSITEISTFPTNDRVPLEDSVSVEEHPVQEDAEKELSHDNYAHENVSTDELTSATSTEQLIEEYSVSRDTRKDVLNEELTNTTGDNCISENLLIDEKVSENVYEKTQHDTLTTETMDNCSSEETLKDKTQVEQHVTESVDKEPSDDDFVLSTKSDEILVNDFETKSDLENIPNDQSSNKINPINIEPGNENDEDLLTIEVLNKSLLSNVSENTGVTCG